MTEHELQNRIRVALSDYGLVFRTNAGSFWQGKQVWSWEQCCMVLTDLQKVEGLPAGFPDLLFIDARGCAFIEVKAKGGRLRAAQKNFLDRMRALDTVPGLHVRSRTQSRSFKEEKQHDIYRRSFGIERQETRRPL